MCFFHTFRGCFLAKTRKFISPQEAIPRAWYAGDTVPDVPSQGRTTLSTPTSHSSAFTNARNAEGMAFSSRAAASAHSQSP